jgi:hypothetical protein
LNTWRAKKVAAALSAHDLEGLCRECPHFSGCRRTCKPVQVLLNDGNPGPAEWSHPHPISGAPQGIRVLQHDPRCRNVTSLGDAARTIEAAFSTENRPAFPDFDAELTQTRVFIERFFWGESYADIATRYETTEKAVRELYRRAKLKILEILEAIDNRRHVERFFDQSLTEFFTKGQRWFLLHRLFGLRLTAIAELDGAEVGNVKNAVQEVEDRLVAGERCGNGNGIELPRPPVSPRQVAFARERIERKRARRRAEHAARKTKKR